jgi:hypothetical protein
MPRIPRNAGIIIESFHAFGNAVSASTLISFSGRFLPAGAEDGPARSFLN